MRWGVAVQGFDSHIRIAKREFLVGRELSLFSSVFEIGLVSEQAYMSFRGGGVSSTGWFVTL